MHYSVLKITRERRIFDPNNEKDISELSYFLKNNKWMNGCPFYLEEPYEDIPYMCKDKYVRNMLSA